MTGGQVLNLKLAEDLAGDLDGNPRGNVHGMSGLQDTGKVAKRK